ncbi:tautomerase family protein [Kordiimonas sp. SCSIO 12610]|uniref:tautomerase family protein n=1 Tax=Kordiimonas sp. SCSIO 12610 TaxID=2829597 RepID=UPI00210C9DCD|nr:tautomerase family protein [Kordiimonas sp. SCSIO 12610]UTW56506.1 tautomerase family protein [Kordiimonas sp. SCSIO 12610]
MPLYVCNSRKGLITNEAKAAIAKDITDIHCEVTAAPPTFVHAFFFEEATHVPIGDSQALLLGQIRAGRTDEQKAEIVERMRASINHHTGIELDDIVAVTTDTPASWVMEGGDLLPEPGEEEEWLAAHEAKLASS